MSSITQNNFSLNLYWMRVIGLYPPDDKTVWYTIWSYVLYLVSFVPTAGLGVCGFVLDDNIEAIDYNAFTIYAMVIYTQKFLPFITNGKAIKDCINFFDAEIFTFLDDAENAMGECRRVCRRNTIAFFGGGLACVTALLTKTFFWGDPYELAIKVWLPYSLENRPVLYGFTSLMIAIGYLYVTIGCGTMDPLIYGLASNVTAHLRILKYHLDHLGWYLKEGIDASLQRKEKIMYQKLTICIRFHQAISSFVLEYETCFSYVVFVQLFGSVLLIGLGCLQLTTESLTSVNFLTMSAYISFVLFQIFCFCYYGTTLYEESKTLSTSIYMGCWYNYDPQTKQALVVLMERSKKPMLVTVGGLLELSLDTFTTILKRSYSFLTLMKSYK